MANLNTRLPLSNVLYTLNFPMDFLSFSEILSPFECATHNPLVLFQ